MTALPLHSYHSYEHYVSDLSRAEKFYTQVLGYKRIGISTPESVEREGMQRLVMAGGKTIHMILSQPVRDHAVGAHYLKNHPEGIAFLNFKVRSLEKAIRFLEPRGATFLYEPINHQDRFGKFSQIGIATALDDVNYRFIEDHEYQNFAPSFQMLEPAGSYRSPYGYECIDHITSNVRTLQPLIAFYRDVLGFEEFWRIAFHTNDVDPNLPVGSGLKSIVMWHPDSGIKFANNEPARPFFRNSQIDIYCRDNRGSGVQHVALRVPKIIPAVRTMWEKKLKFLTAPPSYYERVPARLKQAGFSGKIREDMKELAELSLLVDASSKGYLLQIFTHELSRQFDDPHAGAVFYEIIQREGDDGFGAGNFRALFETIEIDQIAMARRRKPCH
jgi:4-hydroxyphenylpyruvate dioxygenase